MPRFSSYLALAGFAAFVLLNQLTIHVWNVHELDKLVLSSPLLPGQIGNGKRSPVSNQHPHRKIAIIGDTPDSSLNKNQRKSHPVAHNPVGKIQIIAEKQDELKEQLKEQEPRKTYPSSHKPAIEHPPSLPKKKVAKRPVFNYTTYWEEVEKAVTQSAQLSPSPRSPAPCPRVYVYDLPPYLTDFEIPAEGKTNASLIDKVFGHAASLKRNEKVYKGYLRHTDQYAMPAILEYRLRKSELCQTKDPQKADLFYVPILTKPKSHTSEWTKLCQNISGEELASSLKYLNHSNACRHFFAIGKGHYNAKYCKSWWSEPAKELKSFRRLAYSHMDYRFRPSEPEPVHIQTPYEQTKSMYPNLFSVPYPSSLHFKANISSSEFIFPSDPPRDILMLYLGTDSHGDVLVRERITKQCHDYNKTDPKLCMVDEWRCATIAAKARATFCLEPAGDSPWRKSLSDDITFGCIPVLFSELTDAVAPWFWQDWKKQGRILVPRDAFVAGEIDLKTLLQSIPPQVLRAMQKTLEKNARKFQYSTDEDDDGVRVILDSLHQDALLAESHGTCG